MSFYRHFWMSAYKMNKTMFDVEFYDLICSDGDWASKAVDKIYLLCELRRRWKICETQQKNTCFY